MGAPKMGVLDGPERNRIAMAGPEVVDFARDAIIVLIKLAAPIMGVSLVVGLTIALLQALTQVQEITLVFVPKILSIFVMLIVALPFMGQVLSVFMQEVFQRIVTG
jgi:flagellar biosynthetic protein FliQ